MTLTTPYKLGNHDIYTEEGFFLYWKSSSLLWTEVIEANFSQKYLIIPVNWPSHLIDGQYDFGQKRKELDLKKLIEVGANNNKTVILMFAVSPSPFGTNGGVPSSFATQNSITKSGMISYSVISGQLSKHFSFFASNLYKEYSQFLKRIGGNLKEVSSSFQVATAEYGFVDQGIFRSFFEDRSPVFYSSLEDYKSSLSEREQNAANSERLADDFTSLVKGFYFKEVRKVFSHQILGHQRICVVNGSEFGSLTSIFSENNNLDTGEQILDIYSNEMIPLSLGINKREKGEIFSSILRQLVSSDYLDQCFSGFVDREDAVDFLPVSFFSFLRGARGQRIESWVETGLISYLGNEFKRVFTTRLVNISSLQDTYLENKILFVDPKNLERKDFFILKEMFYSGAQIIFDSAELEDQEQAFMLEMLSSSEVQKEVVNIGVRLNVYSLNSGTMILFDSRDFKIEGIVKEKMWRQIINSLSVLHLRHDFKAKQILSCWRSRLAKPFEMEFDEVRRLSLINVTDYKKELELPIREKFYLLKTVDKQDVEIEKVDKKIIMTFKPRSSVSLDFGVVYEG